MMENDIEFDRAFLKAVDLIGQIELRPWPEGEPMYTFHEGFESDIKEIKRFCKIRSRSKRSLNSILSYSNAIHLMSPPYYLYYLPTTLLATIQQPKSQLASIQVISNFYPKCGYTEAEQKAVHAVRDYLAIHGLRFHEKMLKSAAGRWYFNTHRPAIIRGIEEDS